MNKLIVIKSNKLDKHLKLYSNNKISLIYRNPDITAESTYTIKNRNHELSIVCTKTEFFDICRFPGKTIMQITISPETRAFTIGIDILKAIFNDLELFNNPKALHSGVYK